MGKPYRLLVQLSVKERRVLNAIARHRGISAAAVLRAALAWYAWEGPWIPSGEDGRRAVLDGPDGRAKPRRRKEVGL